MVGDVPEGRVLDLGPVWQATVAFFTARGFRVSTEDVVRGWRDHLRAEEDRLRRVPIGRPSEPVDPSALAERFFQSSFQYPPETFHIVLAWDVFDHLDPELQLRLSTALLEIMRSGAAMLALFHSKPPAASQRFRIRDAQTLELVPATSPLPPPRTLQNREILNLFARFRSTKTVVGRDQLRESLILK